MKIRNQILVFLIPVILLTACGLQPEPVFKDSEGPVTIASPAEILQADIDFANTSKERGMKQAFIKFMAKEAVLLRPDRLPITGADAIEYISQIDDSGLLLSWIPEKATVSEDGTLGYTYGMYTAETGADTLIYPYVHIWKKQEGEWKFILETYTQGY